MSKKILAVDDSRTMLESIRISLEKEGYGIDTAVSGEEALALLKSNRYDLVFTDYNMPEMDGVALVKKIRRLLSSQSLVPIIMVTTESQNEKKIRGKIAGVTGWVVKPFRPDQLVSVVEKVTC